LQKSLEILRNFCFRENQKIIFVQTLCETKRMFSLSKRSEYKQIKQSKKNQKEPNILAFYSAKEPNMAIFTEYLLRTE